MNDYTNLTPSERFEEIDRLATQLFKTTRWKTAFAARYSMTRQAIATWQKNGPPDWALVAISDALAAKRLEEIKAAISEA